MVEKKTLPQGSLPVRGILCPMDFSEFSVRALRYAILMAGHFEAHLFVQHTVPSHSLFHPGGASRDSPSLYVQSEIKQARLKISGLLKEAGLKPAEVHVFLNEGKVVDRILETVSKHSIDLVVMGTHGHKGFSRLVLGSVAEETIHRAGCPVLVVSHPEADLTDAVHRFGARWQSILLATDLSDHSDRALAYALQWACSWGSKVLIFHAVEEGAPALKGATDLLPEYNASFKKLLSSAWDKIRHLVPEAVGPSCEVTYEVRPGHPKEEILRLAEEKGSDLIIMGARGSGRATGSWGSVSSAVVRDGRFPVLILREGGGHH